MGKVLTIAGSDSGGGAGIQADLKSFTALGAYGMTAITAVTAQNTLGVQKVFEMPVELVEAQIDSVCSDIGVDAAKTGMLASAPVVELVARKVKEYSIRNLVVDPVMVAKSGHSLLSEEARTVLREQLLPLATVVTPNIPEASVLTEIPISNLDDMYRAAKALQLMGAQLVVLKGGHLPDPDESVDLLYDGKVFERLRAPRIQTQHTHGTGCTFAAAIAAGLARGMAAREAIQLAKHYVSQAITEALEIGHGRGPTNHLVGMESAWMPRIETPIQKSPPLQRGKPGRHR
jgi:hydroxymethylpyrimidine/phosphomethylpyrimidine kinase